jgi:TatD DNase family protein
MLAGEKGRNLVSRMPLDRVLPETDGPFAMTDGVALKPWDAWGVCSTLSELWALPLDIVEEQLKHNLRRLLSS